MDIMYWKHQKDILAGTTLRSSHALEHNNLALHVGGNLTNVLENREALSTSLGITSAQWTFAHQTHSDHIFKVTSADMGKGAFNDHDSIQDCDALYTKEKGIALGVFHADCVPVLLYDPFSGIIAAIHSGWQGTIKEITRKTLIQLIEKEQVNPAHIQAYIGPAIAFRSFEIGPDVLEKVQCMSFPTASFIQYKANGKAVVDTRGLNRQMLLDLGVPLAHIHVDKNDTFMKNEAFFSYRRDHDCGRHLSFIIRK